jgi:hypothetical protein
MEDKILNAGGQRITPSLLSHAREIIGADSGVFVMRPEQVFAYAKQGASHHFPSGQRWSPSAFTIKENYDIPLNEVHLETPKGRVKITNLAESI